MADGPITECPNCKRLEARIEALESRLEALEAENARLRRDSSNSHKSPSSDIVKPRRSRPRGRKKRRIGGRPGHARHQCAPLEPDQTDETRLHGLQRCPDCGGELQPGRRPVRITQHAEPVEKPVVVTEHPAAPYWCAGCRKVHYGELRAEVRAAGLVGARPTALVAWLKGSAHASCTTIQALLRDVLGGAAAARSTRAPCAQGEPRVGPGV